MTRLAKPAFWLYPIPFWEWRRIHFPDAEASDIAETSYAVHLWNGMIYKEKEMDKNKPNADNTLIGALHEKYS